MGRHIDRQDAGVGTGLKGDVVPRAVYLAFHAPAPAAGFNYASTVPSRR